MRKRVRDQGIKDEERRNKDKGIKERSEEREKRKDGQLLTSLTLTVLSRSLFYRDGSFCFVCTFNVMLLSLSPLQFKDERNVVKQLYFS